MHTRTYRRALQHPSILEKPDEIKKNMERISTTLEAVHNVSSENIIAFQNYESTILKLYKIQLTWHKQKQLLVEFNITSNPFQSKIRLIERRSLYYMNLILAASRVILETRLFVGTL